MEKQKLGEPDCYPLFIKSLKIILTFFEGFFGGQKVNFHICSPKQERSGSSVG
jgi:hypothetical protein